MANQHCAYQQYNIFMAKIACMKNCEVKRSHWNYFNDDTVNASVWHPAYSSFTILVDVVGSIMLDIVSICIIEETGSVVVICNVVVVATVQVKQTAG